MWELAFEPERRGGRKAMEPEWSGSAPGPGRGRAALQGTSSVPRGRRTGTVTRAGSRPAMHPVAGAAMRAAILSPRSSAGATLRAALPCPRGRTHSAARPGASFRHGLPDTTRPPGAQPPRSTQHARRFPARNEPRSFSAEPGIRDITSAHRAPPAQLPRKGRLGRGRPRPSMQPRRPARLEPRSVTAARNHH